MKNHQIQNVINSKKRVNSKNFAIIYTSKIISKKNIAILVGKKIGKAYLRNKIKRQIKSVINNYKKNDDFFKQNSIIILCKRDISQMEYTIKKKELEDLIKKIK